MLAADAAEFCLTPCRCRRHIWAHNLCGGSSWQWSQTKNDPAESRTPGLEASIRIAETAPLVKEPEKWEGEHRGDRMDTADRADETCMDVTILRKTHMTRYLSQFAHTRSAHKVCRTTMTLNNEKKCACNRWCCVQLRRASDQALGWKRKGESAELIITQPKFDPKTIWLIIDSLKAIKWAYVWAGHALDTVVQRFTAPFVNMVRQRPQELDAIKPLYESAVREIYIIMRGGETFEPAVQNVINHTS